MPIFEYKCRACGEQFEALIRPRSTDTAACPACHGQDLEQMFSAFGVNSAERSQAVWNAAQKKFERTELRDKRVAEREAVERHLHEH
jgi:putative FmdB family regulatory protein